MILLTGASGFIGKNFISSAGRNISRAVIRRDYLNQFQFLYPEIDFFTIDKLTADTEWGGAFNSCQAVIHLAGLAHSSDYSEVDFRTINFEGTINLASAAAKAGVKRFVFVSTIGVNGTSTLGRPFSPLSDPVPHNYYAQSKYDTELALKKISFETGLELVIVRPTLVYGPDAPGNFGLLAKLLKNFSILPFGLATNKRDFISVQNLADLLMICATHPNAAGHIFLASDCETVSIKHFINAIAEGLGKRVFQLPIPVSLIRLVGKLTGKSTVVEQLFGNLQVDSSNIKEVLDWTPPLTMKQAMATLRDSGK
ncbi:NAD-dependent epimerase/dehydratase family protein [Shewanella scandinavica]|uniref:NAD-dependent epimerase/dehydratase family protein n=1 Tax=Shewanella scandinavica TaxID=3063538 RepID=A0ABU3FUF0_9GAMM|nr:NAD-dependent epimerase/dehydratase family protein [Shewanella sp. SP2S1-2]MDT3278995.1 NAD-dependent epimerase/dehydratase family protein [Shewanella sp. SP2S1-2]